VLNPLIVALLPPEGLQLYVNGEVPVALAVKIPPPEPGQILPPDVIVTVGGGEETTFTFTEAVPVHP
jgi:hypothetical protein